MTWTLWSEFYGKFLELHLVTAWDVAWTWLLCYSWSHSPRPGFYPAKFWALPQPQWCALHSQSEGDGTCHSLRGSTQKEPGRACWTSPGSLTCTYRYLVVNTPHYKVCTINTTNNLQITQVDEFLSISWAVQGSWAKSTSGTTRWIFLSTHSLKHNTGSKMLL